MRRIALVVCVLVVGACGLLRFDVNQTLPEQRVQGSPTPIGGVLPSFLQVPITINIESETAARKTGPAQSAFLKTLRLQATPHNDPSGNFDFLDEVHIYIRSANNTSLPEQEIATLKPVPRGQTTVDFSITPNIDILPYIKAGAQITSTATGHQPATDFTFDGRITVTVRI